MLSVLFKLLLSFACFLCKAGLDSVVWSCSCYFGCVRVWLVILIVVILVRVGCCAYVWCLLLLRVVVSVFNCCCRVRGVCVTLFKTTLLVRVVVFVVFVWFDRLLIVVVVFVWVCLLVVVVCLVCLSVVLF